MVIKHIGLDYFVQPILALDRISLHNAYFPETKMKVIGFGRTIDGAFNILVEQPFICGSGATQEQIENYAKNLGFTLINPRNWTYANSNIYLSDLHDENVIISQTGNIFVIDCDIRINIPELHCEGRRSLSSEVAINE